MENPVVATVLADTVPAASADRAVRVEDFTQLCPRAEGDPQRLYGRVTKTLDHYFFTRGLTYLDGQRDALSDIIKEVLDDSRQGVFAVPLVPGGGKSTLLRALLTVFAEVFRGMSDPIAQRLGGIVVVVEKTAEGDELEQLCNNGLEPGEPPVARLLSAVNDYNLKKGRCLTGEARTYAECPRHACREAANCPLLHTMEGLGETPILILLHARLAEHLPDLTPFTSWCQADGTEPRRSLLLIDEAPELVRQDVVSAQSLNEAEGELLDMRPSYSREDRYAKQRTLESFVHTLRIPFDRLQRCEYGKTRRSAVLTASELEQAGFKHDDLAELLTRLEEYQAQRSSKVGKLATALLADNGKFSCFGKNFELALPSLHTIRADTPLRTFIFSGTAQLIPQLTDNPNVTLLDTNFQESYARLTIHVQRDNVLKTSRTGLQTTGALEALVLWLQVLLPELAQTHGRVLLVSYKRMARRVWELLGEECQQLVFTAVIPENGEICLPYFGGVVGSNAYRDATAVVCLGLPRLEPGDYLRRALAIDPDGSHAEELSHATEALERQPCALKMQDIHLAHELVQMVFRSRLRCHGDKAPIELWLTQPPDAVLALLHDYFGDCRFEKHNALPAECHSKLHTSKQRNGIQTNAARLYEALLAIPEGSETTPAQLREQTGLTQDQYKEAMRAASVRELFRTGFTTFGSGKNQKIHRVSSKNAA